MIKKTKGFYSDCEDDAALLLRAPDGAYTTVSFTPLVRTTTHFLDASAGTSSITPNNGGDAMHDVVAHSEWTAITSSSGEGDVRSGNLYLLCTGDFLQVSQISDPTTHKTSVCQELWTSVPMWEVQKEPTVTSTPCLLVASIASGKGKGLMIRLGDYCQGVALLDGWGLHIERWKRVAGDRGSQEWIKDPRSTTWIEEQEENAFLPGEWLCRGETRLGHGIVIRPSSVHTIWKVIEESWL